jgi:hypothetical protein
MALLDTVCRIEGVVAGETVWSMLRDLGVALRPAGRVVVNNLFAKVLKPRRGNPPPGEAHAGPLQKTIAYREYAYFDGTIGIALDIQEADAERFTRWLLNISYLGKRGSFMQLTAPPSQHDILPDGFIHIDDKTPGSFSLESIMQPLDDCGQSLTFEKASIYTASRVTMGKDRVLRHAVLPYRVASSSRSYTLYEHT